MNEVTNQLSPLLDHHDIFYDYKTSSNDDDDDILSEGVIPGLVSCLEGGENVSIGKSF